MKSLLTLWMRIKSKTRMKRWTAIPLILVMKMNLDQKLKMEKVNQIILKTKIRNRTHLMIKKKKMRKLKTPVKKVLSKRISRSLMKKLENYMIRKTRPNTKSSHKALIVRWTQKISKNFKIFLNFKISIIKISPIQVSLQKCIKKNNLIMMRMMRMTKYLKTLKKLLRKRKENWPKNRPYKKS